jgi:hypothetical protein
MSIPKIAASVLYAFNCFVDSGVSSANYSWHNAFLFQSFMRDLGASVQLIKSGAGNGSFWIKF